MPAGLTTRCLTFRDIFVCTQHPYSWCSPTQASQLTLAFKRGVATLDGGSTLIYGLFQKSRVLAQEVLALFTVGDVCASLCKRSVCVCDRAKGRGLYNRLGRAGRHHADDHLVESEYRSVFLKLFPRYAGRARRGATVAGDHLRGTAVVVENAPKSLSRHDGASVIRACRQRCDELVAETLVVPFCVIVHYVFGASAIKCW